MLTLSYERLFCLTSSPFLLAGVINQHLEIWEHPDTQRSSIKQLRDGLYVDDLMTGGATVQEVETMKSTVIEVFEDASFTLHKWHSNAKGLETSSDPPLQMKN